MRQVRQAFFKDGGAGFVDDVDDRKIVVARRPQRVEQEAHLLQQQQRHLPRDRPAVAENQQGHALHPVQHVGVAASAKGE